MHFKGTASHFKTRIHNKSIPSKKQLNNNLGQGRNILLKNLMRKKKVNKQFLLLFIIQILAKSVGQNTQSNNSSVDSSYGKY